MSLMKKEAVSESIKEQLHGVDSEAFDFRNLLLALENITLEAKNTEQQSASSADKDGDVGDGQDDADGIATRPSAPPKPPPAERLYGILQKAMAKLRRNHLQEKLQVMLFDWLGGGGDQQGSLVAAARMANWQRAAAGAATAFVVHDARKRQAFWAPLHADCARKKTPLPPLPSSSQSAPPVLESISRLSSKEPDQIVEDLTRGSTLQKKKSPPVVQSNPSGRTLGGFRGALQAMAEGVEQQRNFERVLTLTGAVELIKAENLWPALDAPLCSVQEDEVELSNQLDEVDVSLDVAFSNPFTLRKSMIESLESPSRRRPSNLSAVSRPPTSIRELEEHMRSSLSNRSSRKFFKSSSSPALQAAAEAFPNIMMHEPKPTRRFHFSDADSPPSNLLQGSPSSTSSSQVERPATPKAPFGSKRDLVKQADSTKMECMMVPKFDWSDNLSVQNSPERWEYHRLVEDEGAMDVESESQLIHHPAQWTRNPGILDRCSGAGFGRNGPLRFPQLRVGRSANDEAEAPQWGYLRECVEKNIRPRMPSILLDVTPVPASALKIQNDSQDDSDTPSLRQLNLAHYDIRDEGLRALSASLVNLGPFDFVDISDNALTNETASWFLTEVLALSGSGGTIIELNLAENHLLGGPAIRTLTSLLQDDKIRRLQALSLSGIPIPEACWSPLVGGLLSTGQLKRLAIADTRLGYGHQGSCEAIVRLIAEGVLVNFDASGNFFRHEGCAALANALAHTEKLETLDLSHNAGDMAPAVLSMKAQQSMSHQWGVVGGRDEADGGGGGAAVFKVHKDRPPFSPLLLVCESLRHNKTLHTLCLSLCALEYSADFVLEDAIRKHPVLERLDLSDNPHGYHGARCILRSVTNPNSKLGWCDISGFRDSTIPASAIEYDNTNPGGTYRLELINPQHRAMLRTLLHRCCENICDYFQFENWNGIRIPMDQIVQKEDSGLWKVPSAGVLKFVFALRVKITKTDPVDAMREWQRQHKIPLTLARYVTLLTVYTTCVTDEQRKICLRAVGNDMLLKTVQLKLLVKYSPVNLGAYVVQSLFHAITDLNSLMLFDVLPNREQARKARHQAGRIFLFNLRNATGAYDIDLSNACDRGVAERLQALAFFEKETEVAKGKPDTSQTGGYNFARNARFNGYDFSVVFEKTTFMKTVLPYAGILTLDYMSPTKVLPGSKKTSDKVLRQIWQALLETTCVWSDKLQALRCVLHHLTFSHEQVRHLVQELREGAEETQQNLESPSSPMKSFTKAAQPPNRGVLSGIANSRDSVQVQKAGRSGASIWKKARMKVKLVVALQKNSAFMGGTTGKMDARSVGQEVLVSCFTRCCDPWWIATDALLYDPEFCNNEDLRALRRRLGYVHTFDFRACSWNRTNYADATDIQDGNRYSLDLSVNEDHCIADYLIKLAAAEPGENIMDAAWSEATWLERTGGMFLVPSSWVEDVPKKGVFKLTYVAQRDEYIRPDDRRSLGASVLGWELQSHPRFKRGQTEQLMDD